MKTNATLKLSDGTILRGIGYGHTANTSEKDIVFNTSVVGYVESLTDPSSAGQIVVYTFPLLGNYGVVSEDSESQKNTVSGIITRHICDNPSNFRSQSSLDGFLKSKGIPCISGIDTRGLVQKIRESGGKLSGKIIFDTPTTLQVPRPLIAHLTEYSIGDKPTQIALVDLGIKNSTKNILLEFATIHVFGADVEYNKLMSKNPTAIVVCGGSGNPSSYKLAINLVKANLATKSPLPMFGIGLGHFILALGHDYKLTKLANAHRGNQAIRQVSTGKVYQTSNNTGWTVNPKSIPSSSKATYINVNDGTIEGLFYKKSKSMSIQFFPDNIATIAGTRFVWDEFFMSLNN